RLDKRPGAAAAGGRPADQRCGAIGGQRHALAERGARRAADELGAILAPAGGRRAGERPDAAVTARVGRSADQRRCATVREGDARAELALPGLTGPVWPRARAQAVTDELAA